MADRRIQQLPLASTLGSSDIFHISQGGIDKRIASDTLISQLNGGTPFNFDIKTISSTSKTLSIADRSSYLRFTNAADIIVTVPSTTNNPWLLGDQIIVRREGGRVDFTADTGVILNGGVTGLSLLSEGQNAVLTYVSTNTWDIETGGVTEVSTVSAVPSDRSSTIDAGVDTVLTLQSRDQGASVLKVHGDAEGSGRVFVGQSDDTGGGIEYNGDSVPDYTGAGRDYTSLYRVDSGSVSWTAKNSFDSNDWIFRGDVYTNEDELVYTSGNLNTSTINAVPSDASSTIDAGTSTDLTILSDNGGVSSLSAYGGGQGTGKLYVGQSDELGGGIGFRGNTAPDIFGAGNHFLSLYKNVSGAIYWTAKNKYDSNNWIFRGDIYTNETDLVYTSGNLTASTINAVPSNASSTIDAGTSTTVTILSDDDGESVLNLHGDSQGTGRVFVGQSEVYGGGIEYNGDGVPVSSGAGSDYVTMYRRSLSVNYWTAKNSTSDNDWIFRDDVYVHENKKVYSTNNITSGTAIPTGGNDDDIYIQLDS